MSESVVLPETCIVSHAAPRRARIVLVCGPPCCGKSTTAARLAAEHGGVAVDIDEVRSAILPESRQAESDRDTAYRCLHLIAAKLAAAGVSLVVLAATYARSAAREALRTALSGMEADIFVIECGITPDEAVRRFRQRASGHPANDLTDDRVRLLARQYPYDAELSLEAYLRQPRPVDLAAWIVNATCASPESSRA